MTRWKYVATVALAAVGVMGCGDGGTRRAPTGFSVEPGALEFGPNAIGHPRTLVLHLSNTGRTGLSISSVASSSGDVVPALTSLALAAGEQRDVSIVYSPSAQGALAGNLDLQGDGPDAVVAVPFSGTGVLARLSVGTPSLDFGSVELGQSKSLPIAISNATDVETTFRLALAGTDVDEYGSTELGQDVTVDASTTHFSSISFSPTRLGYGGATASVTICDGCQPVSVSLTGLGIASTIEIDPYRLDFGTVQPGTSAQQPISIRNVGNQPLAFTGAQLVQASSAFSVSAPAATQIAPGASLDVVITFTPATYGEMDNALVQLGVTADNTAGPKIPLSGRGGASCLVVSPPTLAFGAVAEGMSETRKVSLLNRCGGAVQLNPPSVVAGTGGFFSIASPSGPTSINSGAIGTVAVQFTPSPGAGASTGTADLSAVNGAQTSSFSVGLTGVGEAVSPCIYAVEPASIDFGTVAPGTTESLGFAIVNLGTDRCFVSQMDLVAGTAPVFSADPFLGTMLDPGGRAFLRIDFSPAAAGTWSGLAEAWVSNPTNGHPTVALAGSAAVGCFALVPASIDFGTKMVSCGKRTLAIAGVNQCTSPVTVTAVALAQATSAEIQLRAPAAPISVAAGGQVDFPIDYTPVDDGQDAASLQATVAGVTYSAGILGAATTQTTQTDHFQLTAPPKVDILIVMDNSGSMATAQASVTQNVGALLTEAQMLQLDFHIGVTTTGIVPAPNGWSQCPGGAQGGEAGRLFPVDGSSPRIITPSTPNAAQALANNVQVGVCHWWEEGLEAAYRALSTPLVDNAKDPNTPEPNDGNLGFYRSDAKLVLLFVQDDDDESQPPLTFYETFFQGLKGNDPTMFSASAIAGPPDGTTCMGASCPSTRYSQLVQDTGGVFESIQSPNWAATIQKVADNAFGPQRVFPLSQTPGDPTQITVQVDGQPATGWTYDPTRNAVVFGLTNSPPAGATVDVTYPLGC